MSLISALTIAGDGMSAQSMRLATTVSNLANANSVTSSTGTPYRAREIIFAAQPLRTSSNGMQLDTVRTAGVVQSNTPLRLLYEPGNPLANPAGYVQSSNVNPIESMVNMLSASRAYQDNVTAANVLKTVAIKTLSL
ncbi:MAG: flagellar basal body rod protein FlgC [Acidithiobacillus ferriphilus]|uniref:flagellar basal body rod protein FlgC n=1 Tax=Acidithiobacillus ferriphilus TaxID=1689834 RepID=UPI001C06F72B|nr:flagellar basal body rod protein FlgC [Acidithiobacillus ferriphilus]MBU2829053.1 flagellar basal body rod protein FlgC [Acidithiobacillus ferriphilus]MBU2844697.1 flagellar basal body rod protein FlgC [Acidithiobacillus ferriphilus]MBU2849172.1 flagellar basal body rod protein FlgC [Acidithiobacillus ferriphilus]MEB8476308.1 flagellar basal body rod protein FlgC [Acidithiobacillus ferriphilus]MEB8535890.1 flagellar basal body rod protein FlgC [Acidithiobacillus ferriphilus]